MTGRTIPGSGGFLSTVTRHNNAANLLMALMVIFGIYALGKINTQFFPDLETDTVEVSVAWPGASAEDIENNVIKIIEPEVRFLDGVKKMISYAREGSGSISLEFNPGSDMQKAVSDAEAAVKAINTLPEDSETPNVFKLNWYDRVGRVSISGDVPEATLRVYAKKMRDDLIALGIDRVEFTGMRNPEVHVEVPERELRRLGLSVSDISGVIADNSRDTPSGQIEGKVEKQIRALAAIDEPGSLGRIEVRSFASGEKVLLEDIASIRQDYEDGEPQGFTNSQRAIQLTVQRAATADTLQTAKILEEYLASIKDDLPPGIKLQVYEVRANALIERILLLLKNGLGGLVIVVAMLFIFLNARIAFWVAAGIPVAMLATIGILLIFGQSINMISLFAMIMMLGVIVDDAIVVGEETATRFEAGNGSFESAEQGAQRMVTPVLAAMVTTIVAFAPILLIGDVIGQIMGVMPIVVIAVIIASVIECFLILPGHLAHTLKERPKRAWSFWRQMLIALVVGTLVLAIAGRSSTVGEGGVSPFAELAALKANFSTPLFIILLALGSLIFGTLVETTIWHFREKRKRVAQTRFEESRDPGNFRVWFDGHFKTFKEGYFVRLVEKAFRWRYVTVSIALASIMILAVGLIRGEHVKFVFFPSPESENIQARLVFNAGIPQERALEIINEIESSLYKTEEKLTDGKEKLVTAVFVNLGQSGWSRGDNLAELRVQLTTSEARTIRTNAIVNAWRNNVPKLAGIRQISVFEVRGGPPGRDLALEITGGTAAVLKQAASKLINIVSLIDGVSGVADDLPYGKPELIMQLKPRGGALGFTIEEVGRQVRNAFEGAIPRRYARGDDEVTIRVKRTSRDKGGSQLRNFELKSPNGEFVPLEEVVSLTEKQGFSVIRRQDGKTIVSITADLDTDITTTEDAVRELEMGDMSTILAVMGLDYNFGGRSEERKEAFADLFFGVVLALLIIYIILAWVFADYFKPLAIMLIIPFGIVGAVFGHWILGYKLTILSFVGLLGLAGILVNDSIILVSRLDERLKDGEDLFEAAIGASRDRLRAVLLTSLTTIGGLIPLMFEKSVQAQFLLPMAITIVFGLGMATLLVLFLVPAFIGIGSDIGWTLRQVFGERKMSSQHPAA